MRHYRGGLHLSKMTGRGHGEGIELDKTATAIGALLYSPLVDSRVHPRPQMVAP